MDSWLKSVSNFLSNFSVLFLVRGLVISLVTSILGCFLVILLLFIDLCISIIKSNTSILFIVSCSGSGITSGNNNYIISISIGLIRQYLDIMLYVIVGSIILSWIIIISASILIESL
jgi:hypothetical protein